MPPSLPLIPPQFGAVANTALKDRSRSSDAAVCPGIRSDVSKIAACVIGSCGGESANKRRSQQRVLEVQLRRLAPALPSYLRGRNHDLRGRDRDPNSDRDH